MNKLYMDNLKYIKKLNKKLYEKIKNTEVVNCSIKLSKNGQENIFKTYKNNDVAIYSRYNPNTQAEFVAKYALKDDPDIIFLFGIGLGYELKEMIKMNDNIRYFIVEPDAEIFKKSLEILDIRFLFNNNNIFFILDNIHENISNFFESLISYDKTVNVKFIVLPTYKLMYEELINKINEYIKEILNKIRINIRTLNLSNRAWCQAFIANLKYLYWACPVQKLKPAFNNVPAIMVSAGPSLNYNLDELKNTDGKAIIAAVGTGIQILEKNCVKADLVGAIDVWRTEEELFENLRINKDIPLFYSSHIAYKIQPLMEGTKFLMNCGIMDMYINKNMKWEEFNLFTGPSIANAMAYNLSQLGCNPIIFLGQDMCFSEESWYARGAKNNKQFTKEQLEKEGCIKTKNKKNKDVYTLNAFLAMKTSMEKCIEMHPHIKYLNGTEDGLKIEGAEDISFNKYIQENFITGRTEQVHEEMQQIYDKHIASWDKNILEDFINSIRIHNQQIVELTKELISSIESDASKEEKVKHINSIVKKLEKNPFYNFIVKNFIAELEFIYSSKPHFEKIKQQYAYLLDKCLIMENAFEYEVFKKE